MEEIKIRVSADLPPELVSDLDRFAEADGRDRAKQLRVIVSAYCRTRRGREEKAGAK